MKIQTLIATTVMGLSLAACGGKAAMEDLEKLKEKTCSCAKDDAACIGEATTMAKDWATKHANARGGDPAVAEKLATEILGCSMTVGLALAGQ